MLVLFIIVLRFILVLRLSLNFEENSLFLSGKNTLRFLRFLWSTVYLSAFLEEGERLLS